MRIFLLFTCLALWSLGGCISYSSGFQQSQEQREAAAQRAKEEEESIALLISRLGVRGQAASDVKASYRGLDWWIGKKGFSEVAQATAFEHIGDMDGNGLVDEVDRVVVGYLAAFQLGYGYSSSDSEFSITELEKAVQIGLIMSELNRLGALKGVERVKPMSIKNLQQWGRTLPVLLDLWDDDSIRSNNQELFSILHEVFSAFVSLGEELFLLEVEKRLENKGQSKPVEGVLSPLKNLI